MLCSRASVLDAAVSAHRVEQPVDVALGLGRASGAQESANTLPLGIVAVPEEMDEHEAALAFPEVAEDLFAILGGIAQQVQEIILNLESCPEKLTEAIEAIRVNST